MLYFGQRNPPEFLRDFTKGTLSGSSAATALALSERC